MAALRVFAQGGRVLICANFKRVEADSVRNVAVVAG
jgi:hypothetical protein